MFKNRFFFIFIFLLFFQISSSDLKNSILYEDFKDSFARIFDDYLLNLYKTKGNLSTFSIKTKGSAFSKLKLDLIRFKELIALFHIIYFKTQSLNSNNIKLLNFYKKMLKMTIRTRLIYEKITPIKMFAGVIVLNDCKNESLIHQVFGSNGNLSINCDIKFSDDESKKSVFFAPACHRLDLIQNDSTRAQLQVSFAYQKKDKTIDQVKNSKIDSSLFLWISDDFKKPIIKLKSQGDEFVVADKKMDDFFSIDLHYPWAAIIKFEDDAENIKPTFLGVVRLNPIDFEQLISFDDLKYQDVSYSCSKTFESYFKESQVLSNSNLKISFDESLFSIKNSEKIDQSYLKISSEKILSRFLKKGKLRSFLLQLKDGPVYLDSSDPDSDFINKYIYNFYQSLTVTSDYFSNILNVNFLNKLQPSILLSLSEMINPYSNKDFFTSSLLFLNSLEMLISNIYLKQENLKDLREILKGSKKITIPPFEGYQLFATLDSANVGEK